MIKFPPNLFNIEWQQRNLDYVLAEWNHPTRQATFNYLIEATANLPIVYVMDIGANVGVFSKICCEKLKNAKIVAFEPDLENYNILIDNIDCNRVSAFNC